MKASLQNENKFPVYQNSLTPLGYYHNSNFPSGTTFIIAAGAAGEVGYSKEDFWAADDCFCFRCAEDIQDRFLYYTLLSQHSKIKNQARKASIPRISRQSIENLTILLPNTEKQKQIVENLDHFDQLCHDLATGLPAEIEKHQKRYEYYRDKLLSFPEKK